jgi:hypothetical protein
VASVTKLHPGATGASANAAVASALRKLAAAYQALSAAAAHGNKPAYKRAQQQIAGGESSLRAAFAQLGHDGYTLG